MKRIILLLSFIFSLTINSQKKPNIVIIHTDDLGYHDLSLTGSQLYDTPSIDKLAKESVSFTNAYSSYPRCTPSRYAMFTGTYPVNENKGWLGGIPKEKNFIMQFNNAGYATSYVGKWHIGKGDSAPDKFGFSHIYAAGEAGGIASRHYPFNITAKGKKGKYNVPNVQEDGKEGDYASDLLTDATIKFIKNNPKVLVGFSDITVLHQAIYAETGLVTFHGPVGSTLEGDYSITQFKEVLMNPKNKLKIHNAEVSDEHKEDPVYDRYTITDGVAQGKLVGGNLSLIVALSAINTNS